ncbi:MAG: hypothetical protein EZS28_049703, partial [Streblomastix strix]
MQLQKDKM